MEAITKTKGKRSKKLAKAVTTLSLAVALIVSGGTFAIWESSHGIAQQPITIQAGELSFDDERAAGSWTLNGVPVPTDELSSVKLVPGDKVEYSGSQVVRVVGDNLTGWLYFEGLGMVQGELAESPAASLRWAVDGQQEAKQLTSADHLVDQPVSFSVTMAPMGASVYGDGSLAQGLALDLSSVRVAVSSLRPAEEEDLTAPWIIEDQAVRTAVLDHLGLSEASDLTVGMKKLVSGIQIWDAPAGSDFSELAEIPDISSLHVTGENLGDAELTTIPELPWLRDFTLRDAQHVTNLSFLKGEKEQLTGLDIANLPSLTSMDAVSEMEALQSLNFRTLPISALPDFSSLSQLGFVQGSDLPALTDVSGLEGAGTITSLHLSAVPSLTTLGPIPTLAGLQSLSLAVAPEITDFNGLSALTGLTSLEVSGTNFADLTLLSGMTDLEMLSIKDTAVTDLGPLATLLKLTSLYAYGLNVEDWSPVEHVSYIN